MNKYDCLKLENQLCFPLYAASKEIIRKYKPLLDKYDLTYTQYITMMVLWENNNINEKELGKRLFLDSGTLTPLLKKLEQKEYIKKDKLKEDERNIIINVTKKGMLLKEKLIDVPRCIGSLVKISEDDAKKLYEILYKILEDK